jgi:hypothetical protein
MREDAEDASDDCIDDANGAEEEEVSRGTTNGSDGLRRWEVVLVVLVVLLRPAVPCAVPWSSCSSSQRTLWSRGALPLPPSVLLPSVLPLRTCLLALVLPPGQAQHTDRHVTGCSAVITDAQRSKLYTTLYTTLQDTQYINAQ